MSVAPHGVARRRLDVAVKRLLQDLPLHSGESLRVETSRIFKDYYILACGGLRRYFLGTHDGSKSGEYYSKIVDILLLRLCWIARERFGNGVIDFSLLAVGGYGRYGLAPYSDIDILFLWRGRGGKSRHAMIDFILYNLWDLGLEVGHASRSVVETLRLASMDHTVATSLLESRFITGRRDLYKVLRKRFFSEVIGFDRRFFALRKLDERDGRHVRMGDTRYVLEPNIKEGKGALRDLHFMRWLGLSFYGLRDVSEFMSLGIFTASDYRAFVRALSFFMTVRFHLHYQAGRASEILTFDAQIQIAESMGYRDSEDIRSVERLMRSYFLHATAAAELTRILATDLRQKISGDESNNIEKLGKFFLQGGRLNICDLDVFYEEPIQILEIFELGLVENLDFHPDVFRAIHKAFDRINLLRGDERAYRIFLRILIAKEGQERILRNLSESGFLGRFLLDFGKVQAQMQYDMYHVYTTDEHTIRAIDNLSHIECGKSFEIHPLAHEEIHKIGERKILYMAVFLHDIAKGQKGDHSILGAQIALRLCPKFGFTQEESELVAWLVEHHLLMSNVAFKRNLDDARTISNFVDIVRTAARLRLLLCLTVADITAVGPNVWNNWKAHLIRVLFRRAFAYMSGYMSHGEALEADMQGLQTHLWESMGDSFSDSYKRQFLSCASPSYYLSYTPEELLQHAGFIYENQAEPRAIRISTDEKNAVLHLLVYVADSQGLIARICGAIALCSFNIVEARTSYMESSKRLISFTVQNKQADSYFDGADLRRLRLFMEDSISIDFDSQALGRSLVLAQLGGYDRRTNIFSVKPQVHISNQASLDCTMIEIKGRDRMGLVFALSSTLHRLGLDIFYARIATFGEEAHDVFYVQDDNNGKIIDDETLDIIRESLFETLQKNGSF